MDLDGFKYNSIILSALVCLLYVVKAEYKELSLGDGKVCKLNTDINTFRLYPPGSDSTVIVKDGGYFKTFTGRYGYSCSFRIKVKDRNNNYGLYAVVQELNFRKNYSGDCLDYVDIFVPQKNNIFKLLDISSRNSRRFCGNLSPGSWLHGSHGDVDLDSSRLAPNAFVAPGGEVEVLVHMANERLHNNEELAVSIAFTSYKKDCYDDRNSLTKCRIGECIDSRLVEDEVQNCPYESCADELGCHGFDSSREDGDDDGEITKYFDSSGLGPKLTFGAAAIIVFLIVLFGACLFFCKRMPRRPAQGRRPRARNNPATPMSTQEDLTELPPSAPPIPDTVEIKDAPPSYDSLYPTAPPRPAETNT